MTVAAPQGPLTSIIIPTYNHATWLGEAIECVLMQTAPAEAIVVDDGSTDGTPHVLAAYAGNPRVTVVTLDHRGPSVARNEGLAVARGAFVMFLDADDLIAPTKVERQRRELEHHPEAGWCLCDVRIEDEVKGRAVLASEQYGYASKELSGWVAPLLEAANWIPIMAPLIRREVLDTIRFTDDRAPEDWYFWQRVAHAARLRYLPAVLATYRHRRTGRSRLPKAARAIVPNVEQPLRLNLGCGTPNTRSWHPITGLVNLDKSLGWRFEDGLREFADRSVAGITVSHALMYVDERDWPFVFGEFARVLEEGGVVRVTEDETVDEGSSRLGGWRGSEPAVTLTSPARLRHYLDRAGFTVHDVGAGETRYRDGSLTQAQHGDPPDVFFLEGVKDAGVVFAPHNDDETLFAAFTILRYRPRVVVCYPSTGDYGDPETREHETRDALSVLGGGPFEQWDGQALEDRMRALDASVHPVRVWAPSLDTSHRDHVAVATAALRVFGHRVTPYHTYRLQGVVEKVRSSRMVEYEPAWISQKLRALARYQTQISHPRAHQFFLWDLLEYYEGELS